LIYLGRLKLSGLSHQQLPARKPSHPEQVAADVSRRIDPLDPVSPSFYTTAATGLFCPPC